MMRGRKSLRRFFRGLMPYSDVGLLPAMRTEMQMEAWPDAQTVIQAEQRALVCEQAWERYGRRIVTDEEVEKVEADLKAVDRQLSQLHSWVWAATMLKFAVYCVIEAVYWVFEVTGVAAWGCVVGGMIVGTVAVALSVVPLISVFDQPEPILIGFALCFLLAGSITAVILRAFSCKNIAHETDSLRTRLEARRKLIGDLQKRKQDLRDQLQVLQDIRRTYEDYKKAAEEHRRLVDILKDRRYQLLSSNWRSLRGEDFERFIAEIFEMLGYTVEKTPTTGDQGVDLIIAGKGRRIAVQCKGYKNRVGNAAVQEVYAGATFYGCQECAVITNSSFTSGAINLARTVGCQLIDSKALPALIRGEVY